MNSVPSDVWEWTASLGSGERVAIIILGVFAIVLVVIVVFGTICKMHKNRLDDALKRELLERGMSAEEIATVIRAKPAKSHSCRPFDVTR